MTLSSIKGVIYDLDGTLVDSSLNFAQIRAEINCPSGVDTLKFIDQLNCENARADAHQVVLRHELDDARQSKWLPGAQQLVNRLADTEFPQAIVTRNCIAASQIKVDNNGIPIELVITREQFAPKPAPDALLHIARKWQLAPQHLLYVGDFKYDIEAGNNAGMMSCLVTNGKQVGFEHQADLIVESLEELALLGHN